MMEIKSIYKTFNKDTVNSKRALGGVSLNIAEGDFVTVIGGNGAGKSTLLNAVSGVCDIDCGEILLDGINIARQPEHRRAKYFGRVFQDPMMGTAASMEIQENLALANRRGSRRGLRWWITAQERKQFKEQLKRLVELRRVIDRGALSASSLRNSLSGWSWG